MITDVFCQDVYDLYEDLDVVLDAQIEVIDYNRTVTLNVNGTEIKIEGELADKIYKAVESRIDNLKEQQARDYAEWCNDQKAWEYWEEKRYMKEGRI